MCERAYVGVRRIIQILMRLVQDVVYIWDIGLFYLFNFKTVNSRLHLLYIDRPWVIVDGVSFSPRMDDSLRSHIELPN